MAAQMMAIRRLRKDSSGGERSVESHRDLLLCRSGIVRGRRAFSGFGEVKERHSSKPAQSPAELVVPCVVVQTKLASFAPAAGGLAWLADSAEPPAGRPGAVVGSAESIASEGTAQYKVRWSRFH